MFSPSSDLLVEEAFAWAARWATLEPQDVRELVASRLDELQRIRTMIVTDAQ